MHTAFHTMVSIASVAEREASLRQVVESLLPQVDRLNVYLNGYAAIPDFLRQPSVTVARSQDHGDPGDAGKFFWLDAGAEYYLTCDDDIDYPPDYVARTIATIEKYQRRAVVGWHGSILLEPFAEYYRDRRILSFYAAVPRDTPVHILGTGAVGFHTSTLRLAFSDFPVPNMADVWFGAQGQRQHVPFVVRAHAAGELLPIGQDGPDDAIWRHCVEDIDSRRNTRRMQNQVVVEHRPWMIHEAPRPSRRGPALFRSVTALFVAAAFGAGLLAWREQSVTSALALAAVTGLGYWIFRIWRHWPGSGRK